MLSKVSKNQMPGCLYRSAHYVGVLDRRQSTGTRGTT